MIFDELISVIDDIDKHHEEFVLSVIRKPVIQDFIVEQNQRQLNNGFDSNTNIIVPLYTQTTIRYKISKGQPFDKVTLKDTGAFHNSIKIIFHRDSFEIVATDKKRRSLKEKYGAAILGLNDASIEALRVLVQAHLRYELLQRFEEATK